MKMESSFPEYYSCYLPLNHVQYIYWFYLHFRYEFSMKLLTFCYGLHFPVRLIEALSQFYHKKYF